MKVTVGVLGIPRNELDAMIMPKERTSEDINKAAREMPEFKLPPVKQHRYYFLLSNIDSINLNNNVHKFYYDVCYFVQKHDIHLPTLKPIKRLYF